MPSFHGPALADCHIVQIDVILFVANLALYSFKSIFFIDYELWSAGWLTFFLFCSTSAAVAAPGSSLGVAFVEKAHHVEDANQDDCGYKGEDVTSNDVFDMHMW